MSGGVEEVFDLNEIRKNTSITTIPGDVNTFWKILLQARRKKSVICCNVDSPSSENDSELPNGLVNGHAYVITTLVTIPHKDEEIRLLKIHNPWGTEVEWKLDWSKKSSIWKILKSDLKKHLLDLVKKKGQFWLVRGVY